MSASEVSARGVCRWCRAFGWGVVEWQEQPEPCKQALPSSHPSLEPAGTLSELYGRHVPTPTAPEGAGFGCQGVRGVLRTSRAPSRAIGAQERAPSACRRRPWNSEPHSSWNSLRIRSMGVGEVSTRQRQTAFTGFFPLKRSRSGGGTDPAARHVCRCPQCALPAVL